MVSLLKPYWNRYWFERDLEAAAIFGTKNSVKAIKSFLADKMQDRGWNLSGEDFLIEKDGNNTVYIGVSYEDEIEIFGATLKKLEFTVRVKAEEVKEYL